MNTESVEYGQRSMYRTRFVSVALSKASGLHNIWINNKIERKIKKIVHPTVFKLYILRIPTWSFKANKYA